MDQGLRFAIREGRLTVGSVGGPEARALATNAQLIIEGTITRIVGGGVNFCKPLDREATASEPVEIHGEECWIGANVSGIAFTGKSGEVLKEWVQ